MDLGKRLAGDLPSAEEILRALGLHGQRSTTIDLVPGAALFGAGMLVGAGLALLFAPASGRELRQEIGDRAADLRERVRDGIDRTDRDDGDARPG
jgi:hypothetical protein